MNVDVEIYLNKILKFFRENPKDLLNLVPKEKEELFYRKIKEVTFKTFEESGEVGLTQKQIIEICVEINQKTLTEVTKNKNSELISEHPEFLQLHRAIMSTKFGKIYLN